MVSFCTACESSDKSGKSSSADKTSSQKEVIPNSESDFAYETKDNSITITGYKGTSTTVNIPSEIDGKPVTVIGEKAFDGYEEPDANPDNSSAYKKNNINSITSVNIPDSVKTLELGAFTNCYSMVELTLGNGIEEIKEGSFACCDKLTSVVIPDSVKSLEGFVFYECYNLSNVTLSKNLESIGQYCFYSCYELSAIDIPDSVKELGEGCFSACDYLTDVKIGSSVTEIPKNAFYQDFSIKNITLPKSLKAIGEGAFTACSAITEIKLPDTLETVEANAFYACKSLLSVTVPENVSSIAEHAFGFTQNTESGDVEYLRDFVIHGKSKSTAQAYCEKNKITFSAQ